MAIAVLLFASCKNEVIVEGTDEPETVEPEVFPDTVFASVNDLDYDVEIVDTIVSGQLKFTHSEYQDSVSQLMFRGNPFRDADFHGKVKGKPSKIVVDWRFETGMGKPSSHGGSWMGGNGWTGQPLYVQWPDSILQRMRKSPGVTTELDSLELIIASMCGEIYFINPTTGKKSREPIDGGAVLKGTPSLDPSWNGNLYVGQGVSWAGSTMGNQAFNLYTMERTFYMPNDPKCRRHWNAFDSSAICAGGFLFWPGENGTLYKYVREDGGIRLHSTLRYNVKGYGAAGMESSMSVYSNYGYVSDSHGNVLCVNLNSLKPVWRYDNKDDSDASPVLALEDGVPYIYAACEVDKRGDNQPARLTKLNGLTGEEVWCNEELCVRWHRGGKDVSDGGYFGTPLLGRGNCENIIFVTPCKHGTEKGVLLAIDRKTGNEIYRTKLKSYAWSSMVGFYNEQNEMYIFLGDCVGNVYLIEAKTGKILYTELVGNNFEASPVAFGNSVVVGSRGNQIIKMSIQ